MVKRPRRSEACGVERLQTFELNCSFAVMIDVAVGRSCAVHFFTGTDARGESEGMYTSVSFLCFSLNREEEGEGVRQAVGLSTVNGVRRIWDSRHGMYPAQSTLPMGFALSEFDVYLCVLGSGEGGGGGVSSTAKEVFCLRVAVVLQWPSCSIRERT